MVGPPCNARSNHRLMAPRKAPRAGDLAGVVLLVLGPDCLAEAEALHVRPEVILGPGSVLGVAVVRVALRQHPGLLESVINRADPIRRVASLLEVPVDLAPVRHLGRIDLKAGQHGQRTQRAATESPRLGWRPLAAAVADRGLLLEVDSRPELESSIGGILVELHRIGVLLSHLILILIWAAAALAAEALAAPLAVVVLVRLVAPLAL